MKRISPWFVLAVALLALGMLVPVQASHAGDQRVSIGGGSAGGGTYFVVSTAMARIITKFLPGYVANSQATGGGPQNIGLLNAKKIQFGLASNLQAGNAFNGLKEFKDKAVPTLRAVTGGYQYGVYLIVPKNSAIKSYKDVVGKNICVGPHGGSFWPDVRNQLLLGYNIKFDDFNPQYLGYSHAINALKDGRVDGAFSPCGTDPSTRSGAVVDVASTKPVRFVSISAEAIEKIRAKIPSYIPVTIKPGFFPNQDYEFKLLATPTCVLTRADVSEELVYKFIKTLYAKQEEFKSIYAGAANYVDPAKLQYLSVPLHKGALKFYKEKGLGKYLPKK